MIHKLFSIKLYRLGRRDVERALVIEGTSLRVIPEFARKEACIVIDSASQTPLEALCYSYYPLSTQGSSMFVWFLPSRLRHINIVVNI